MNSEVLRLRYKGDSVMRFVGVSLILFGILVVIPLRHGSSLAEDERVYQVVYLPEAQISLNGEADEKVWNLARVETHFTIASSEESAPATEFRALCSQDSLFFYFDLEDDDLVVLEELRNEEDQVFEDRIEIYFTLDRELKDYYCFEVDPKGRIFDYHATYYREFDTKWDWDSLEASGRMTTRGYSVEGRIPLSSLEALGFPLLRPGSRIRAGLYRAEFSHDRSGREVSQEPTIHNLGRKVDGPPPIQSWITWIDPGLPEADFHMPSYFGWLQVVQPSK